MNGDAEGQAEWEAVGNKDKDNEGEDEGSKAAVDQMLKKYKKVCLMLDQ